jgi:hypothetical protein
MKLIRQAYQYIEVGDSQAAGNILESLVNIDPLDIEAWEAYMQICNTCEELDIICERVLQVPEINTVDRKSLLDYYYFLRQKKESFDMYGGKHERITFKIVDHITCIQKDAQPILNNVDELESFGRSIVFLLNAAMFVSYAVLMIIGFRLFSSNNNFGYWIMAVLLTEIILGGRNILFNGKEKTNINLANRQFNN